MVELRNRCHSHDYATASLVVWIVKTNGSIMVNDYAIIRMVAAITQQHMVDPSLFNRNLIVKTNGSIMFNYGCVA